MRVVIVAQEWPDTASAAACADDVANAWAEASPRTRPLVLPVGDGGPRSASIWAEGKVERAGGCDVIDRSGAAWLMPGLGGTRWDVTGLSAALLGLAAAASTQPGVASSRVVVPVGDEPPAGDATTLWGASPTAVRHALQSLDIVVLVGSDRPLLGFHGMSAALVEGHEGDAALAVAAHAQEARWAEHAKRGDALAGRDALLGSARPSQAPGTGAAGGLAYALHVLGARLTPGARALVAEIGLPAAAASADLVVAIVPELTPRVLDHGLPAAVSHAAGAYGVPVAVLSTSTRVGKRDLMAAGVTSAHEAASGRSGLVEGVRRLVHTWDR